MSLSFEQQTAEWSERLFAELLLTKARSLGSSMAGQVDLGLFLNDLRLVSRCRNSNTEQSRRTVVGKTQHFTSKYVPVSSSIACGVLQHRASYDKVFLECDIRTAMPCSDDAMSTRLANTSRAQLHRARHVRDDVLCSVL